MNRLKSKTRLSILSSCVGDLGEKEEDGRECSVGSALSHQRGVCGKS